MKIDNISVNAAIKEAEALIDKDDSVSPGIKATIKMLILIIQLFSSKLNLNSKNSSKPPSSDPNRKKNNKNKSDKKQGGQKGHVGNKLKKEEAPDEIIKLKLDKRKLPKGKYTEVGYKSRQVIDIQISKIVTEYQAQILEDQNGKRFVAEFPDNVRSEAQYGNEIKTTAVYMSLFQLLPYNRIQDYFKDQMQIPMSTGSIFNFNKEAYEALESFEKIVKKKISASELMHADETGININGKRKWLHSASNDLWTHYYPHEKRGSEAMDEIEIIPNFEGIMCHDHWKAYYKYNCTHSLCNAHHLRELIYAEEDNNQKWAKSMRELLLEINEKVDESGGFLEKEEAEKYRLKYRGILDIAEKDECPIPEKEKDKKGRIKKTKSRNLLERLREFENDTLRFMDNNIVPFTNNRGENDLRMTKVQQKISGCFRSMDGAYMFCRIRGYLSTCRKQGISASEALRLLFLGKMPNFIDSS